MEHHPDADLSAERNKYVLYCQDFYVASRYAAERSWWLHSWRWITDSRAPEEPIQFTRKVD